MGHQEFTRLPLLLSTALFTGCVEYELDAQDRVDSFQQVDMKALDLLVVLDNSISMVDEQAHLADNFDALIDAFEAGSVDWRLMVTTTETGHSAFRGRLAGRQDELRLTREDGLALGEIIWDRSFAPDVAWQLDGLPGADPADPTAWCASGQAYAGGLGSPGEWNPGCDGSPPSPPLSTEDLGPRQPEVGELVVSEVMALTDGLDPACEWFELTSLASDSLDLSGLEIADDGRDRIVFPQGVEIGPFQPLVVGRSTDALDRCGTPVDLAFPEGFVLADGRLWVDGDTPDPGERFADLVSVGQGSTGLEMGLQAATLTMMEPHYSLENDSFLRDEANLAILFVSDEDDMSPDPVAELVDKLMGAKGTAGYREPGKVNLLAVTGLEAPDVEGGASCTGQGGDAEWGERYLLATELNGGASASICDDFFDVVSTLNLTRTELRQDFELTGLPNVDSIEAGIYWSPQDTEALEVLTLDADFTLELDESGATPVVHLLFDEEHAPPLGTELRVAYTLQPNGTDLREEISP